MDTPSLTYTFVFTSNKMRSYFVSESVYECIWVGLDLKKTNNKGLRQLSYSTIEYEIE